METILFIIFFPIFLNVSYIFYFAFLSLFYNEIRIENTKINFSFCILIPAYKEDAVIKETIDSIIQQDYSVENYEIILIADRFNSKTIEYLNALPINILQPKFENSTKVKSLQFALERIVDKFDYCILLDADNTIKSNFLTQVNRNLSDNSTIIQAHRCAKNSNNSLAFFDALSEEINNSIFRKGHIVSSLSAALIGSGIIIPYPLFMSILENSKAVGGFDKELEINLLIKEYKIEYANTILVFDEKTQDLDNFKNQKRRWLSAQFFYLKSYSHLFGEMRTWRNFDLLNKLFQFSLIPRSFIFPILLLIQFLSCFFNYTYLSYFNISIFILSIFAFSFSIPKSFWKIRNLIHLFSLPKYIIAMFISLFKLKGANKKFIHTHHSFKSKSGKS